MLGNILVPVNLCLRKVSELKPLLDDTVLVRGTVNRIETINYLHSLNSFGNDFYPFYIVIFIWEKKTSLQYTLC